MGMWSLPANRGYWPGNIECPWKTGLGLPTSSRLSLSCEWSSDPGKADATATLEPTCQILRMLVQVARSGASAD